MAAELEEITRCGSTTEWMRLMNTIDDPGWVPHTRTIINYTGSLYGELGAIPEVARLSRVKQLGLAMHNSSSVSASHTRYYHSLVFATQIDYIAQTLELDRELAVTVAMLHDIASPPFSDSVAKAMGISDEDLFATVLNGSPEALEYLRRHGIEKQRVVNLVRGRDTSPLGQLVNSKDSIDVDRWSYVALDAERLGKLPLTWTEGYMPDPFESVSIINGKVVFGNVRTVREFLEARTQMYEKVYRNTKLMAKEAFVRRVAKELQRLGLISEENLFQMSDVEFERLARGTGYFGHKLFDIDGFQSYGTIDAEPDVVERELKRRTEKPFEVKKHKPVNPAIETPVLEGRKVAPYKELEPQHSADLARRMTAWNRTFVYGEEDDDGLSSEVSNLRFVLGGLSEDDLLDGPVMASRFR